MEDKGYSEPWQPSVYHTSTRDASSSWFSNFAKATPAAAQQQSLKTTPSSDGKGLGTFNRFATQTVAVPVGVRAESRSKGMSRSAQRFGTAAVGLGSDAAAASPEANAKPTATAEPRKTASRQPVTNKALAAFMGTGGTSPRVSAGRTEPSTAKQGGSSIGRFAAMSAKPLPQVSGGKWVKGLLVPGSIDSSPQPRDSGVARQPQTKVAKVDGGATNGPSPVAVPTTLDYAEQREAIRKERELAWKQKELERAERERKRKEKARQTKARLYVPKANAVDDEDGADGATDLQQIAGCDETVTALRELVELPIRYPELFRVVGSNAPTGVLLYGASGVGKTLIARAAALSADATLVEIAGSEVSNGQAGAGEALLREKFALAKSNAPSMLLLDELDVLVPRRTAGGTGSNNANAKADSGESSRLVSQLVTLLDDVSRWRERVVVVATTKQPQLIDPAIRRAGRFDNEVLVPLPDQHGRAQIVAKLTRGMRCKEDTDLQKLADRTQGFTAADLVGVVDAAGLSAIRRYQSNGGDLDVETIYPTISVEKLDGDTQLMGTNSIHGLRAAEAAGNGPAISQSDLEAAAVELGPSAMRELRIERPDVSWSAIGGLASQQQLLQRAIVWPLTNPVRFKHFQCAASRGVLFFGPPGCGKTLLAKAVATECHANFILVKATDILTQYVGESEGNLRQIFDRARSVRPCVIFMDEIDAIAPIRQQGAARESSNAGAADGVVSAMLGELDTLSANPGVVVLGATNRPDQIDPALLRPGRLGTLVYVPLPDAKQRLQVLEASLRKTPLQPAVSEALPMLADALEGYSGADLKFICERAVQLAVRESIEAAAAPEALSLPHVQQALASARKSVSEEDAAWYMELADAVAVGGAYPQRPVTDSNAQAGTPAEDRSPEELRSTLEANIAAIKLASREQRAWQIMAERYATLCH